MGQLEDFRMYVAIVQSQGISKAAEQLGIAKSAVSRRLSLLEDRYQSRLIERGPGRWDVTDTGEQLYQRAIELVGEADEIETDFLQTEQSLAGPLSVSLPDDFGRAFLTPVVLRFQAEHPEIQLNVDFSDKHSDLISENYDFAIRLTNKPDTSLVSERIGQTRHKLYSSARYSAAHGIPDTLDLLTDHPLLHYGAQRRARWEFQTKSGVKKVTFQPSLTSNSGAFLLEAAKNGAGIAKLPDFIAHEAVQSGELVEILSRHTIDDWGIFLLHPVERRRNRRMRAFSEQIRNACLAGVAARAD